MHSIYQDCNTFLYLWLKPFELKTEHISFHNWVSRQVFWLHSLNNQRSVLLYNQTTKLGVFKWQKMASLIFCHSLSVHNFVQLLFPCPNLACLNVVFLCSWSVVFFSPVCFIHNFQFSLNWMYIFIFFNIWFFKFSKIFEHKLVVFNHFILEFLLVPTERLEKGFFSLNKSRFIHIFAIHGINPYIVGVREFSNTNCFGLKLRHYLNWFQSIPPL